MTAIQLACLDLAGTTVRDDGAVEEAFVTALREVGRTVSTDDLEQIRASMGSSKIVVFRRLLGDESAALAANDAFERSYGVTIERGGVVALPGAAATVRTLRAAGVRVCFTTGFSPAIRDRVLAAVGWSGLADLALSPADVGGRGRPFPDLVLAAVLRLGIDDVAAVAVAGDTANDIEAGRRAGASIVAGVLTGAHDEATLRAAGATHVLATIAELPTVIAAALR